MSYPSPLSISWLRTICTNISVILSAICYTVGMEDPRRRGNIRIHLQSIMKALYGTTDYKAVSMRIDRYDKDMLVIVVDHPSLPVIGKGFKYPNVIIERKIADE